MRLALDYAAQSDVGRVRKDNQDSGYAGAHLLVVADGVGGAARGDIASATAISQLRHLDEPPGNDVAEQLEGAVRLVHDRLADLVTDNPEIEGTSTTLTAGIFDGTRLALAHVGDSRAYLLRDGRLHRLTKDHTFVQSLIDEGRITEDEARVHPHRNIILKVVDGVHEPEPDMSLTELEVGDRIFLCSDGCCGSLDDDALARLVGGSSLVAAATTLIDEALAAGSTDNVTVVVAEVVDADQTGISDHPLVVGSAAGEPRAHGRALPLMRRRTPRPEPAEEIDPEALRYAPRPPRRFGWIRLLVGLVVLGVLLWLAGAATYGWTQKQYFVGVEDGRVTVFRGVEAEVPFMTLKHRVERTPIRLADLPDHSAGTVSEGLSANSLARAHEIVANLRTIACAAHPAPAPSPSPTAGKRAGRRTRPGARTPRRTTSPRPSTSPSPGSSPSPSGSPSPSPAPALSYCGKGSR